MSALAFPFDQPECHRQSEASEIGFSRVSGWPADRSKLPSGFDFGAEDG